VIDFALAVGLAGAFQAGCHGFDPRLPLQVHLQRRIHAREARRPHPTTLRDDVEWHIAGQRATGFGDGNVAGGCAGGDYGGYQRVGLHSKGCRSSIKRDVCASGRTFV